GCVHQDTSHLAYQRLPGQQFSDQRERFWFWHGQDENLSWLDLIQHCMYHQVICLPTTNRAGRASYPASGEQLYERDIKKPGAPCSFIDCRYSVPGQFVSLALVHLPVSSHVHHRRCQAYRVLGRSVSTTCGVTRWNAST